MIRRRSLDDVTPISFSTRHSDGVEVLEQRNRPLPAQLEALFEPGDVEARRSSSHLLGELLDRPRADDQPTRQTDQSTFSDQVFQHSFDDLSFLAQLTGQSNRSGWGQPVSIHRRDQTFGELQLPNTSRAIRLISALSAALPNVAIIPFITGPMPFGPERPSASTNAVIAARSSSSPTCSGK